MFQYIIRTLRIAMLHVGPSSAIISAGDYVRDRVNDFFWIKNCIIQIHHVHASREQS